MDWYKIAQEYVGADATLSSGTHIQDSRVKNVENQYLPSSISRMPAGQMLPNPQKPNRSTEKCEKCHLKLEEFEWLGYTFIDNDGERKESYKCSNCGHKNHYNKSISRVRKRRDRNKRRRSSTSIVLREAATPANPSSGWANSYNPANTPMGRLDLSEDERVQKWEKLTDGFDNEFDTQKQKGGDGYKVIKIKGKDGRDKFVRVKKNTTDGDAIMPSNTYTQRGRVKKQRRYNPDDAGKTKENPGAWPHNRNFSGKGSGWYQAPYGENLNAEMRERYTNWYTHLTERGPGLGMSRPY